MTFYGRPTPRIDHDEVPIHRAEWPHILVAASLFLAGVAIIVAAHNAL